MLVEALAQVPDLGVGVVVVLRMRVRAGCGLDGLFRSIVAELIVPVIVVVPHEFFEIRFSEHALDLPVVVGVVLPVLMIVEVGKRNIATTSVTNNSC